LKKRKDFPAQRFAPASSPTQPPIRAGI
jgi:hypothetical protein